MPSSGSREAIVPGLVKVAHRNNLGVHVFAERAQRCVFANGSEIRSREWSCPVFVPSTDTKAESAPTRAQPLTGAMASSKIRIEDVPSRAGRERGDDHIWSQRHLPCVVSQDLLQ